jgi:tetratricopeptide (TPR) repeat protein
MIVRDAERDLPRCLASVRGLVDEVIIVDTGSTDDTPTIARTHAHHYARYDWHDDFAAARNASLSLATGDWILVLDADEELDPKTRHLIRPGLDAADIAAYQLILQSLLEEGVAPASQFQFRLFRNLPGIRYANPIHEQIVESLMLHLSRTGQQTTRLPAVIIHHGYKEGHNPRRAERNQRILRKVLAERPDDPYYLYKLARELRSTDGDESWRLLQRALQALLRYSDAELRENVFATEVCANTIQELAGSQGDDAALALCEQVLSRLPPHPLLHYLRGVLHWRLGHLQPARADLELCLNVDASIDAFYYDAPEIRMRSNAMLGELYFHEGFYNRAEQCFACVLELHPQDSQSIAYQLRIQAMRGDAVGALRSCVAWVQRTADPEAGLLCAELLIALGRLDTARKWLDRLQLEFKERADVLARASLLLRTAEGEAPG